VQSKTNAFQAASRTSNCPAGAGIAPTSTDRMASFVMRTEASVVVLAPVRKAIKMVLLATSTLIGLRMFGGVKKYQGNQPSVGGRIAHTLNFSCTFVD
jgi:hypothetical protein